ncbi:HD domain-containing protein [Patescibacteria group bacterium]
MNQKEIIEKVEKEAKKYFEKANGCHDWSHVERVRKLALNIGKKEKANSFVLEVAALLHDIGRCEEMNKSRKNGGRVKFCHAEEGGKITREVLREYALSDEDVENIVHCVESHRCRNELIPETIEAKVLFDADKIDGLGAIGVGRIFLFAGSHGSRNLYTGNEKRLAKEGGDYSFTREDSAPLEYEIKLKYTIEKMITETGKEIARKRLDFMDSFFENFWKEIEGKR